MLYECSNTQDHLQSRELLLCCLKDMTIILDNSFRYCFVKLLEIKNSPKVDPNSDLLSYDLSQSKCFVKQNCLKYHHLGQILTKILSRNQLLLDHNLI